MGRILDGLNTRLRRSLGLEVLASAERSRMALLLDHFQAAHEAAKSPIHPELLARMVVVARLLKPRRITSHRKIRVGGDYDGGYVMIDDFTRLRVALSLGVGGNVDWDHDLARRGIDVFQFDHTVSGPPRLHPRFHFFRKRIAQAATAETENLASLVRAHGSSESAATILKIDIEGSEWPVFAGSDPETLANFPQILCEFHSLGDVHDTAHYLEMVAALRRLREQFDVVHVHGNTNARRHFVGGQAFPDVIEVTFANRALYETARDAEEFPTDLDMTCDARRPDYFLDRFDFGDSLCQDDAWLETIATKSETLAKFDREAYLAANLDVATANVDPWTHWCMYGWREGRPLRPGDPIFDPDAFLTENPRVAALGFDPTTYWRSGRPPGDAVSDGPERAATLMA